MEAYRDKIPPPDPAPQRLHQRPARGPVPPAALGDAALEQRTREQQRREEQRLHDLEETHGPPPQQAERLLPRGVHILREDVDGGEGTEGAGGGDEPDARADHVRAVAGDAR